MNVSFQFLEAKRGAKGRRLTRHLDDAAVARATIKSQDRKHQMKFLSRSQREGLALRQMLK